MCLCWLACLGLVGVDWVCVVALFGCMCHVALCMVSVMVVGVLCSRFAFLFSLFYFRFLLSLVSVLCSRFSTLFSGMWVINYVLVYAYLCDCVCFCFQFYVVCARLCCCRLSVFM